MTIPTVNEVFEAMERDWTKERFCQGSFAKDSEGNSTSFYKSDAATFCAIGMLSYLTFDHRGFDNIGYLRDEDGNIIEAANKTCATVWDDGNDAVRAQFEAVRAVFQEAQQRLTKELASGDIIVSNDRPRGHGVIVKAIKKARVRLTENTAC